MTTPHVSAWVTVAGGCRLECSFNGEGHLEVLLGTYHDGFQLVFEPAALERFIQLTQRALSLPEPADHHADRPTLVSLAA